MKTNYTNSLNPSWMSKDIGDFSVIVAAIADVPEATRIAEMKRRARHVARNKSNEDVSDRLQAQKKDSRYTPQTQPRNVDGRFRKILARLKTNLGGEATKNLAEQIEKTEQAQIAGNYDLMRQNGGELVKMIDDIQDGDLAKGLTQNLRKGSQALGKILAYLPLPQGNANAKIRFSDLPPASADLVEKMVERVKEQLGPVDAKKYIKVLEEFMSGARTMDSDEMSSNLNKLLRVLA